jgi:hypothetical protein
MKIDRLLQETLGQIAVFQPFSPKTRELHAGSRLYSHPRARITH